MKKLAVMLSWFVAASCFGQDVSIYQGIWQDINKPDRYFTIHENDQTLVLIYLEGVAMNPDKFKSVYIGGVDALFPNGAVQFILSRMSPTPEFDFFNRIELTFTSPTFGTIYPNTILDMDALVVIRKIF